MNWIVQNEVFGDDQAALIAALEKLNINYKVFAEPSLRDVFWLDYFDIEDPVFCYGSIQFIKSVQRTSPWVPGYYADWDKYKLSAAFAHYNEHMFNFEGGLFMPFGQFRWFILNNEPFTQGDDSPFFIRPDSGLKQFAGQVVKSKTDLAYLSDTCSDEEMVFVASYQKIRREYRMFVANGQIVSATGYRRDNELNSFNGLCPPPIIKRAQEILDKVNWHPEDCYIIDFALDYEDGLGVLELNAASTSGLYGMDLLPVIKSINEISQKEWDSYYA